MAARTPIPRLPAPHSPAVPARHVRGDRGSSFTQYAALVLCIAAIAGAVAVVIPSRTENLFETALCQLENLLRGEDGSCEEPEEHIEADPEYDYTPAYCVKQGSQQTYGGQVEIGFFSFGQEYNYAREDLSDGKIVITFLPTTEAGVIAGAGWDFGAGEAAHTGVSLDGSASVKLGSGMIYIFDDEEEFERFEEDVNETIAMEMTRQTNPMGEAGRYIAGLTPWYDYPPEIERNPDVRTTTIEQGAEGALSAGIWAGPGSKAEKKGDSWQLNLGADGSINISEKFDYSTWYSDPDNIKTSHTYSWTGGGSLGASALVARAEGGLDWSGGTRIMFNEDGSVSQIRYMASAEGNFNIGVDQSRGRKNGEGNHPSDGGSQSYSHGQTKSVTQMVQIDFENTPDDQAAAQELLDTYATAPPPYITNAMADQLDSEDYGGEIFPEPGPDADPWDEIFYRRGTAWQYASDKEIDKGEFGASVKLGLQFGASVNWELAEQDTTHALMLDAPDGEDGGRRFVDYTDCLSDRLPQEEEEG